MSTVKKQTFLHVTIVSYMVRYICHTLLIKLWPYLRIHPYSEYVLRYLQLNEAFSEFCHLKLNIFLNKHPCTRHFRYCKKCTLLVNNSSKIYGGSNCETITSMVGDSFL